MATAKLKKDEFKPEVCPHCNQAITYLVPLSKGHCEVLKIFARAIAEKGINLINPTKELEKQGKISVTQLKSFSQIHFHGLLVPSREHKGNWLMTTKCSEFMKGKEIPKYAIVMKRNKATTKHTQGYFMPEKYTVTFRELINQGEYWEGINFTIEEGVIVKDAEQMNAGKQKVFKVQGFGLFNGPDQNQNG